MEKTNFTEKDFMKIFEKMGMLGMKAQKIMNDLDKIEQKSLKKMYEKKRIFGGNIPINKNGQYLIIQFFIKYIQCLLKILKGKIGYIILKKCFLGHKICGVN